MSVGRFIALATIAWLLQPAAVTCQIRITEIVASSSAAEPISLSVSESDMTALSGSVDDNTNDTMSDFMQSAPIDQFSASESAKRRAALALYPFMPGVEIDNTDITLATMTRTHVRFAEALSGLDTINLLDRSVERHPLLPGRNSDVFPFDPIPEATADYILTGAARYLPEPRLIIELIHVESSRIVRQFSISANHRAGFDMAPLANAVESAIRYDWSSKPDTVPEGFSMALSGIFSPEGNQALSYDARRLEDLFTSTLIDEPDFQLLARRHTTMLDLETRILGKQHDPASPDIALYGHLIRSQGAGAQYQLLLYVDRLKGLRKVYVLEASKLRTLAADAIELLANTLTLPVHTDSASKTASRELSEAAWGAISKRAISFEELRRLPHKIAEKSQPRYNKALRLLRQSVEHDPGNYFAKGLLAFVLGLQGNRAEEIALLDELMWDSRPEALRYARLFMERRFQKNQTYLSPWHFEGLPGPRTGQALINELIEDGYLEHDSNNNNGPKFYAWTLPHEEQFGELSVRLSMARAISSPAREYARYKVLMHTDPRHRESALSYNQTYSAMPELFETKYSSVQLKEGQLQQTLIEKSSRQSVLQAIKLSGISALSDHQFIEMRLLNARLVCAYSDYLCPFAQLSLLDILDNTEQLKKNALESDSRNRTKLAKLNDTLAQAQQISEPLKIRISKTNKVTRLATRHDDRVPKRPVFELSLPAQPQSIEYMAPCTTCNDVIRKRPMTSLDGKWFAMPYPGDNVPAQFGAAMLKAPLNVDPMAGQITRWLFDNGYLDVRSMATTRHPEYKEMTRKLKLDFPQFSDSEIRAIYTAYKSAGHAKQAGSVTVQRVSDVAGTESQLLSAPDAFSGNAFGDSVHFSGSNDLWVCDAVNNAYHYQLASENWVLRKRQSRSCRGSVMAGDYSVTLEDGLELVFDDTRANSPEPRQRRKLAVDFGDILGERTAYTGVWAVGKQIFIAVTTRHKNPARRNYHLLGYGMLNGQWQNVEVIHSPLQIHNVGGLNNFLLVSTNERIAILDRTAKNSLRHYASLRLPDDKVVVGHMMLFTQEGSRTLVLQKNRNWWSWKF